MLRFSSPPPAVSRLALLRTTVALSHNHLHEVIHRIPLVFCWRRGRNASFCCRGLWEGAGEEEEETERVIMGPVWILTYDFRLSPRQEQLGLWSEGTSFFLSSFLPPFFPPFFFLPFFLSFLLSFLSFFLYSFLFLPFSLSEFWACHTTCRICSLTRDEPGHSSESTKS